MSHVYSASDPHYVFLPAILSPLVLEFIICTERGEQEWMLSI